MAAGRPNFRSCVAPICLLRQALTVIRAMDAKNIFIAVSHMKSKIEWEKADGNEWSFVGEGKDFKEEKVQEFIDSFFLGKEVYLVIDRHNAESVRKEVASIKVKTALKNRNVTLSDPEFTKMIEFSYIGVAKHGAINS